MPTLLQLSDLHLMSDPDRELKGQRVRDITARVLAEVKRRIDSGELQADRIVITGDLAHDEARETYLILRDALGDLLPRCLLLPGNHDCREFMREVFPGLFAKDDEYLTFSVSEGAWRLIGLDSHVPGEVHGHVAPEQLTWLAAELQAHAAQPTVLFVHHPPFRVGTDWVDALGMSNATELMQLVATHPQIKAICAGHVHQDVAQQQEGVSLFTTPSASLQFTPGASELQLDSQPPGFRLLHLSDKVASEVVRLP